MYSREFAQAAFACCPLGRTEGRLRRTRQLDVLMDLESEALAQLNDAHLNLHNARQKAAVGALPDPVSESKSVCVRPRSFPKLSEGEGRSNSDLSTPTPTRQTFADHSNAEETEAYLLEKAMDHKTPPRRNTRHPNESQVDRKVNCTEEKNPSRPSVSSGATSEDHDDVPLSRKLILEDFSGTQSFRQLKPINLSVASNESGAVVLDSEGRCILKNSGVIRFLSVEQHSDDVDEARRASKDGKILDSENQPPVQNPRGESGDSMYSKVEPSDQWRRVEEIRRRINDPYNLLQIDDDLNEPPIGDGVWNVPNDVRQTGNSIQNFMANFFCRTKAWLYRTGNQIEDDFTSKSAFAVVTFTSRQAAVAARHCLSDGRGRNRWISYEPLPVPPLADSASCDLVNCRGCCRPVTINLSKNELTARKCLTISILIIIYVFYTVPFTLVQSLIQPANLENLFRGGLGNLYRNHPKVYEMTIGFIPGALFSLFLSLLPTIFKAVANSSGDETSIATAEGSALKYYWWFMLITAFAAPYIATTVIQATQTGDLQLTTQEFLINIANTLPTQTSFGWLNWLIFRFGVTLPSQYLLQINTFLFQYLGWNCCKRMNTGGMNGPDVPYRIYVDSGAAFLFAVALSFTSPLVAPAALVYYLFAIPLMRRNCIYVYRPRYDGA